MPTGGLLTSVELASTERSLVQAGLVIDDGQSLVPGERAGALAALHKDEFAEMMVLTLLECSPPLWLGPASGAGEIRGEFIPGDEMGRLEGIGVSPDERDALLLAAGRKFQPSDAPAVGAAGELAVMQAYRDALAGDPGLLADLVHVSLISDQLGYDVRAPDGLGSSHKLEVKTCSTRGDAFIVFLSRNEADTGRKDPAWRLLVCRHTEEATEIVGWAAFDVVAPHLPEDKSPLGRWATARLTLQHQILEPGLPLYACAGAA